MAQRKLLAGAAAVAAATLALTACAPSERTSGGTDSQAPAESAVSVMWNQYFYSGNSATSFGNATANTNIIYMTNDQLTYYNTALELQKNASFGSYEKVSDDPLTVKVTLADTAQWSDGTPVTAADVILAYGAQSGLFNTVETGDKSIEVSEDGTSTKTSGKSVFFDSGSASLALIKDFPVVGDNNKSVTYTYSKPFADWEQGLLTPGLPAHIVAKRALGTSDATAGAQAIIDAFQNKDNEALSKIANVWNSDWNFTSMPTDKDLLVGSGPYQITDYKDKSYITLGKNANYKGEHVPTIDTITVRYNEDPMAAVQALQNNEVQVISPQSTADVLQAVQALESNGVTVKTGEEGTYEHVDLTFNNNGPFDPKKYGGDEDKALKVRQAFLLTIPREKIMSDIVTPLNPEGVIRQSYNLVPGSPSYDAVTQANGQEAAYPNAGDIEKAKSLLDEAGVKSPTVRFMYAEGNQRREQEFQLIKESAEQAGFKVVDKGTDKWGDKLGDKTYDAVVFGWQSTSTAVTEGDANYRSGGQNNFGGYSNKEVDGLYDQLQTETDPAKQAELLGQIEKHLVDDAFGVTIFQFPSISATSSSVEGVDPITLSPTIFWNFWEWKTK